MKRNVSLERAIGGEVDEPEKYIKEKLSGKPRFEALIQLAKKYKTNNKEERAEEIISGLEDEKEKGGSRDKIQLLLLLSDYYSKFCSERSSRYLSEARSYISELQNDTKKNVLLASLIEKYRSRGDLNEAEEIIERILNSLDKMNERTSIGVLKEISNYYFKRNLKEASVEILKESKNIAERINPNHDKGDALIDIADGFNNIRKESEVNKTLKEAARETKKCSDPWKRADIYTTIAVFFYELDDKENLEKFLERAEHNAEKINYEWRRVNAFALITSEYRELDENKFADLFKGTVDMAKAIKANKSRSLALYYITKKIDDCGENSEKLSNLWGEGKKLINKIENPADRRELRERYNISEGRGHKEKTNDEEESDVEIGKIKDPWEKINFLYEKFNDDFEGNSLEDGKKCLRKIENLSEEVNTYWNRDDSYLYIVEIASKISKRGKSFLNERRKNLPQKMVDPWRRAKAFVHIVRYFKEVDDVKNAEKYLKKALKSAEKIDYSWRRALALRYLASAYRRVKKKNKSESLYNRSCSILDKYKGKRKERILEEFKNVYGFSFFR